MSFAAALDVSLEVRATDAEGDLIMIGLNPDTMPKDTISILDRLDGTAEISLAVSDLKLGTHIFWTTIQDKQANLERELYVAMYRE